MMDVGCQLFLVFLLTISRWTIASSSMESWDPFSSNLFVPHLDSDDFSFSDSPFERPCSEIKRGLELLPCTCSTGFNNGTYVNCDGIVFPTDFPVLPYRSRIHGFSQRSTSYQQFPSQLFTASDIPLKRLDLAHNGVVLVTEKLLDGIEDTIEDINLSSNLLGDQLNPVFSTSEFQDLKQLKRLDLSHNGLKGLDDGIIKGCDMLKDLRLSQNSLTRIPTGALRESKGLQRLFLEENQIGAIGNEALVHQGALRSLNLSHNVISNIDLDAFNGLTNLKKVDLSYNKISRLSERLFKDLESLQDIDLSNNFLSSVPSSLTALPTLKRLSLAANLIQNLDSGTVGELGHLENLDLSRNNIAELTNGTLSRATRLKTLHFSVNTLRKVEDDAFKGLDQLEALYLDDNRLLAVPHTALRNVPKLKRLSLSFNRIAVVSGELFASTPLLKQLSLSYNVIRELNEESFQSLKSLRKLDLRGNQVNVIHPTTFRSSATVLHDLDLGYNRLSDFEGLDLPQVRILNIDHNNLTSLNRGQFAKMPQLISLNVSYNNINSVPSGIFRGLYRLRSIDLRNNNLATLAVGIFDGLSNLRAVYLQDNSIKIIQSRSFSNLPQLRLLQLARNEISELESNALEHLPQLKKIILTGNRLQSVPNSLTRLSNNTMSVEILDLSYNKLTSITSQDLFYWTKLMHISLANNRLTDINIEAFRRQGSLQTLNLSGNKLKNLVDNLLSAQPKLRALDLSHNLLDTIAPTALHNSSQLQLLNFGYNRLRRLPEQLLNGFTRLHLNLEHNRLNSLPADIFDRNRVHALLSIHLGYNFFEQVPVAALQKQFYNLEHVNLANNRIQLIDKDADILATIKKLDLSFNPLTEESIVNVLSQPKKVKELNMAATGISLVPVLETPFLRRLNLSGNNLQDLGVDVFQRPALLESLDISNNQLTQIGSGLAAVWSRLAYLKELSLSANPLTQIVRGDLSNLLALEQLDLSHLIACIRVDIQAFALLPSLKALRLFRLPRLETLESRAILQQLPTLESVEIEITEPTLQDQLAPAFLPRIRELHVHGRGGLRSISPATLAGMTSPRVRFGLHDTAITNIPASLLFPVPMSTQLVLDFSGTKLSVLSPQFLAAADNHRHFLELHGLRDNPIFCDCNARPFRRWLWAHIPQRGSRSSRTPRQSQSVNQSDAILVNVASSTGAVLGRVINSTPQPENVDAPENSVSFTPKPSSSNYSDDDVVATTSGEVFVVATGYEDDSGVQELPYSLSMELADVRCTGPSAYLGVRLIDIAEEDLSCDGLGHGEVVLPSETKSIESKDVIDVVVAARPSRPFTPTLNFEPVNKSEKEVDIIWYNEPEEEALLPDVSHNSLTPKNSRTYPEPNRSSQLEKADGKNVAIAATPSGTPNRISGSRAEEATAPNIGLHHMDAVIIGIVGGVVGFVALLIIIICLVRLRTTAPYRAGPMAGALALRHDKCTCLGPGGASHGPMLCHCLPGYPGHALHGPPSLQAFPSLPTLPSLPLALPSSARTGPNSVYSVPLPHKIGPPPPHQPRSSLGLVSRAGFYPATPYYVTFPPESEP